LTNGVDSLDLDSRVRVGLLQFIVWFAPSWRD